jgi:hypothetical protein
MLQIKQFDRLCAGNKSVLLFWDYFWDFGLFDSESAKAMTSHKTNTEAKSGDLFGTALSWGRARHARG